MPVSMVFLEVLELSDTAENLGHGVSVFDFCEMIFIQELDCYCRQLQINARQDT